MYSDFGQYEKVIVLGEGIWSIVCAVGEVNHYNLLILFIIDHKLVFKYVYIALSNRSIFNNQK